MSQNIVWIKKAGLCSGTLMLLTVTPGECDMLFYAVVFNRNKSVESLTCLFLDVIIHL